MPSILNRARLFLAAVAVSLLSLSTGCQTLQLSNDSIVADAPQNAPMYQIQTIPMFGQASVSKEVITENMTVQDALEKANVRSKFRGMEISLGRVLKDEGTVLSMPVTYDHATKSIRSEQNYALHPGDTITVRAASTGTLQKMIGSLTGGAL